MSHYRQIDVRIWLDAKFNALSPNAKLIFFTLLTHPQMNMMGAMRGTPDGLGSEIGLASEPFREGFEELLSEGMVEYDTQGKLIALPNFLKYNPPANPNAVTAWAKPAEYLPECPLRVLVFQRARAAAERFKKPLPEPLREPFPKPENIEHRAQNIDHNTHIQEEGNSKGKRIRERIDADGVVHEDADWGGL